MRITRLEDKGGTLGLLVTTIVENISDRCLTGYTARLGSPYPSSKCLHRLRGSCFLALHPLHSRRNTTFFVVLAFLWKTGFV